MRSSVGGPRSAPSTVVSSRGRECQLTTAKSPAGRSTAAIACTRAGLSGTPCSVLASRTKSTGSGSAAARSRASAVIHWRTVTRWYSASRRARAIRSESKSRAYTRPRTILASGAVKYPSPQHRSSAVMSSLTPSVRSKPEGSGKRAAHQSRDGIDVPANMLATGDLCGVVACSVRHSIDLQITLIYCKPMSTAGPKQQVFASLAEIAQALGHAHRLELLEHLGQGERSVEELAARAGLTLANASRHLQLLRRAALVEGRREGKRVFYRLSGEDAVIDLLRALSRVGERNSAEIARVMASYFHARDEFDPVSRQELLNRLRCGSVAVLDVRPEDEFNMGHLPSALNIPLAQLERRLAELPSNREIVAYCRGPWCVLSFEAVALLRNKGYRARRLEDGFPESKMAGLPVS